MTSRRVTVAVVFAFIAVAACTDGDGDSAAPNRTTTTSSTRSTAASTTIAGTDVTVGRATGEVRADGSLGDGRQAVYITALDIGGLTATVDVVQFLYGDEATKAAAEAGTESPPPNDYFIRNVNTRLRTLPISSGAPVTLSVLMGPETGDSAKDYPASLEKLASFGAERVRQALFWITVDDGTITALQEQYLP